MDTDFNDKALRKFVESCDSANLRRSYCLTRPLRRHSLYP